MMAIRSQAIALLLEKLHEIKTDASQEHAKHTEAVRDTSRISCNSYSDHRDDAALNWYLAYYTEGLVEEIGNGLFERLEAEQQALRAAQVGEPR